MAEDSENTHHGSFLSRILPAMKPHTAGELTAVIHEAGERKIIDPQTEQMLQGVFSIARLRLDDIMIPRREIISIDSSSTVAAAARIISDHGHSRYPVTSGDKDHIEGILLAKDLIPPRCTLRPEDPITPLLRPAVIVPESKRVGAMLREFQVNRFHMAVVIDEFGGVCGLVTIEDILELIVGDINDEYDLEDGDDTENITPLPGVSGAYTVSGATTLSEMNRYFAVQLPEVGVDTAAGLALHYFGHFPKAGDEITIAGFLFKVHRATPRQILSLIVTRLPETADE